MLTKSLEGRPERARWRDRTLLGPYYSHKAVVCNRGRSLVSRTAGA